MELRDALFAALRYELTGTLPENVSFDAIDEPFLTALYEYSNRQEVAHLVGDALDRLGVLDKVSDEVAEPYRRRMAVSAYHAEQQRQVFEAVSAAFDEKKIPYLPLKGLVIRPLYPEPWMRSAGDLDILVKQEDLERAEHALSGIGAKKGKEGEYENEFFFATGVMVELHFRLMGKDIVNGTQKVLGEVWAHTERVDDGRFEYRMADEWFYCYFLTHAARHLQEGICGIRPFLDLWIINHRANLDFKKCREFLKKMRLFDFLEVAERLSEAWLSGIDEDEWTSSLEGFLLSGGVFGTTATKRLMITSGKGGKCRYYLKKLFLPFSELKQYYPILEKHRILFPFVQVYRWFRFLFGGGIGRDRKTARSAKQLDGGSRTMQEICEHMGLSEQ